MLTFKRINLVDSMNFLHGVIWTLKSIFQENTKPIEEDSIAMHIQQLRTEYSDYEISQVRDKGRFTPYVVADNGQQHHHGRRRDVERSLRNQQLIDRAATGEFEFTDIEFENGCLFE